ncbi:hypothetical protein [Spirillospora sp. NPDC029432]|uniref:hypothetical protein n=1 Tax=Spirillospora sp. NPDC029432 TaxID=3154599 RepID=UPI003453ABAA
MSPSLTSRPSAASAAGPDAALAADLAEIDRRARTDRRTRTAIAAGFALIGTGLAGPVLVTVPAGLLAAVALVALAAVGAAVLLTASVNWLTGLYELARPHPSQVWRWRIIRRWYAPEATVWHADPAAGTGPLTVLAWVADPACREPWALVYDGTPLMAGGSAEWLPLTDLTPTSPTAPAPAAEPIGGAR